MLNNHHNGYCRNCRPDTKITTMLSKEDLQRQFDKEVSVVYPHPFSKTFFKAMHAMIIATPAIALEMPASVYADLLDKHDNFTYKELRLVFNNFTNFPAKFFYDVFKSPWHKVDIVELYKHIYEEQKWHVVQWNAFVEPLRKTMNQKMELIDHSGRPGQGPFRKS